MVPKFAFDPHSLPRYLLRRVDLPDTADGCWRWNDWLDKDGYGGCYHRGPRAHRLVYEALVGPIQSGLTLDHLCRVRSCVNPVHMEPVSQAENTRRSLPAMKRWCVNGHEYTPENTYRRPHGRRDCRACIRERERQRRIRKSR